MIIDNKKFDYISVINKNYNIVATIDDTGYIISDDYKVIYKPKDQQNFRDSEE